MDSGGEIWDEFQWEAFMKEQDRKVDRFMELFYLHRDDPNREEIIAREMGWTWLLLENSDEDTDADEIVEEGEGWKLSAGIASREEFEPHSYKQLPSYQKSHEFALRAFRFVEQLPDRLSKDSAVVDFVANAMIAPAKIAGGAGIGDAVEELGGNIAYCKRGLAAANLAIAALFEMKEKKIVEGRTYADLTREASEVRNAIALHILDLRETFQRGG